MRANAAKAAATALSLVLVFTGSLLAKPTRTLSRANQRRLVVTQTAVRQTRERSTSAREGRRNTRDRAANSRQPKTQERSSRANTAGLRATNGGATRRSASLHGRTRTPAEERELAARTAIEAADRHTYVEVHARPNEVSRTEWRGRAAATEDEAVAVARPHEEAQRSVKPADVPADAEASQPAMLTNVGGVLRPTPGTTSLKSVEEEAATPVLLPPLRVSSLYDSRGRLVVPPPLYGSREILLHQNEMAERDGLDRVRDDADLLDLRRQKKLVPLPESETLRVDYRLPENRRFSRPWTVAFLTVLAADFYENFHVPLQVDSAVRTIEVQQRLMRINGNAAPSTGDTASPHLTGQAVDIAKGGLTRTEIAWMRTYLQPLIDLGKIDVEEEFQQSCFHISVYKSYLPIAPTHLSVAAARQPVDPSPERPTE